MAREGYLVNAGEETIHGQEVKPLTEKEKRKNWWYYNKVKVIVGVVAVLLVGSMIYSVVTKVTPDYSIALMTSYDMPDEVITQLERHLEEYGEDLNQDGKVIVQVNNYVFTTEENSGESFDPNVLQATVTRFAADCSSNESILFLHDEYSFSYLENMYQGMFSYNDGTPMPEDATDFENAMLAWDDVKGLADFEGKPIQDNAVSAEDVENAVRKLRISIREDEGSSIEKKEKTQAYYDACMELYERLKSGEKTGLNDGEMSSQP